MKNNIIAIIILTIMFMGCYRRPHNLDCSIDIEILKENIKSITNADTVLIYTRRIKEEPFFQTIKCPQITIENPSTNTLDFKSLPIDKYQPFENFKEIEQCLKREGYPIAKLVMSYCNMTPFNDLMIRFYKKDSLGKHMYDFRFHYDEFIDKKEPKKLPCTNDVLIKEIKSVTNADNVLIYTKSFDIYMYKIVAPVIEIDNATTESLDFKTLPTDKYQGFGSYDNYCRIWDNLKDEGYPFAKQLSTNCNLKGFNSLVVDFVKKDSLGYPVYHFRCLYDELLLK